MLLDAPAADVRGCLIVNSATEMGPSDDETSDRLRRHMALAREILGEQIRRGQADGSVTDRIAPETLTAVAYNAWLGIRVEVRTRTPRPAILRDVEELLNLLSGS